MSRYLSLLGSPSGADVRSGRGALAAQLLEQRRPRLAVSALAPLRADPVPPPRAGRLGGLLGRLLSGRLRGLLRLGRGALFCRGGLGDRGELLCNERERAGEAKEGEENESTRGQHRGNSGESTDRA